MEGKASYYLMHASVQWLVVSILVSQSLVSFVDWTTLVLSPSTIVKLVSLQRSLKSAFLEGVLQCSNIGIYERSSL